jgi:hypothetical protein
MQTFYINVLVVSTIMLVLYLIFIGIITTFTKNLYVNKKLKPCPDFWKSYKKKEDTYQYCQVPKDINKGNLDPNYDDHVTDNNGDKIINFYSKKWSDEANKNNLLLKDLWKKWANSKKISWDTVTNT